MRDISALYLPVDTAKADEIEAVLSNLSPSGLNDQQKAFSRHIAGNSPYLSTLIRKHPDDALSVIINASDSPIQSIFSALKEPRPAGETRQDLMRFLRQAKTRIGLVLALLDIASIYTLEQVTNTLSDFADLATALALSHLLHERMTRGQLAWPDSEPEPVTINLARNSGLFVLALGKLGGQELNYSSDIDLIILYDPDRVQVTCDKSPGDIFIRLTRDFIDIMEKRTADGYVFRTDLRLRPDPGATPLAMSVYAAETYYQSLAQNWERAAMIKARPIAGDNKAANSYLDLLSSWIWRRSIDFTALTDLAAIKDQVIDHFDQATTDFVGYDLKVGNGGIREIEFFVQIQQLLFGGRRANLRTRQTLDGLRRLADAEIISTEISNKLTDIYCTLRTWEHRIQMLNDEQTHKVPTDDNNRAQFIALTASGNEQDIHQQLNEMRRYVRAQYETLLPDSPSLTGRNTEYSPANLAQTLAGLGFTSAENGRGIIDGWRRGRVKALKTDRSRNLLESCLPQLITAFAETAQPDEALSRFDRFVTQLPAGVQLFSLLQSNPSLFRLIARIMGLAPALAETLAKRPYLWDAVLEPDFFAPLGDKSNMSFELKERLKLARDYQDILDITRRFAAEQKFRIGVHILESLSDIAEGGAATAQLADTVLQEILPYVAKEFEIRHGRFSTGGLAVLAMGQYGGGTLTPTSDLDLVLLYDISENEQQSNGDRPLYPGTYFARLGQHLITAITALTQEGRLFDVDTRLRPNGQQGSLVVTLDAFEDYYRTKAWTWEHMALTRARVVLAPDQFAPRLMGTLQNILSSEREGPALLSSVAEMRSRLAAEFNEPSPLGIKHVRGGLVDIEFIVQYLTLRDCHDEPKLIDADLYHALERLAWHGSLMQGAADTLAESAWLQQNILAIKRLCLGEDTPDPETLPLGLKDVFARAAGAETFDEMMEMLLSSQKMVRSMFENIIDNPAKRLKQLLPDG